MYEFALSAYKAAFDEAGKGAICHAKRFGEVERKFAHAIGHPI
jgi:hypothetical protein